MHFNSDPDPLQRLASTWDQVVQRWIEGSPPWNSELEPWLNSYSGKGPKKRQDDAIPEPFSGRIDRPPKAILLALNPGRAFMGKERWSCGHLLPDLQSRQGRFAQEIERAGGSFTTWSSTPQDWRKLTDGPDNPFVSSRLRFVRDWMAPSPVTTEDVVWFEMYPWHSYSWGSFSTANPQTCKLIDRFVIQPIASLYSPWTFAFGKPWFDLLPTVGFVKRAELGSEIGSVWKSQTPSRRVGFFQSSTTGCWVIAMRHNGSAGPPKSAETGPLRDAIVEQLDALRKA